MQERLDIWFEKFNELYEIVGSEEAWAINDSLTDRMLGVGEYGDGDGEILGTEETIEELTDDQFEWLIECLTESIAIETEVKEERIKNSILTRLEE